MDFIFNYILTNQHIFYFPILCYFSVKYFNESYRLRQTINLHHSSENEEPDLIKPVRNLIANLDNKKSLIKVALQELLELTQPDVVVAGLLLKNQNQFQVEQIYNIENKLLSESLSNIITEKFVNLEFSEISKLFGYQYIPEKYKKNLEIFGINLTYTFPVYDQRHGLIGAILLAINGDHNFMEAGIINRVSQVVDYFASFLEVNEKIAQKISKEEKSKLEMLQDTHDLRFPGNSAVYNLMELKNSLTHLTIEQKKYFLAVEKGLDEQLQYLNKRLNIKAGCNLTSNHKFTSLNKASEEIITNLFSQKTDSVTLNVEKSPVEYIYFKENDFKRIIYNLLSNAFKYTDCGVVKIFFSHTFNKFKIHIADTGCGIKSGEVDKLFQSYSRLSNANTKEGFGIGLSSCQDLARVNNSIITFQPNRESSSGSVFTLEIPSEYILQYQNTLLVDDEELVIKSNIRSLKNISKEINSSMSLTQALEQIKNKKYDLVISDYNLSCDKAWPIIEHAKAKNPLVKIIILSGEEIKELNDRNVRFLLKPAKRKDIINTLAEMEWG